MPNNKDEIDISSLPTGDEIDISSLSSGDEIDIASLPAGDTEPAKPKDEPSVLEDFWMYPKGGDIAGATHTFAENLADIPVVTPLINKAGEYGMAAAKAAFDKDDFKTAFKKRLAAEQAVTKHFEDKKKEGNKAHPGAAGAGAVAAGALLPAPSFVGHGLKAIPAEAANVAISAGVPAADTLLRGGSGKDAAVAAGFGGGARLPFSAYNLGKEAVKGGTDFVRRNVFQVSDELAGKYAANRDAVKKGLATKESADRLLRDLQDDVDSAYAKHIAAPTDASAQAVRDAEARLKDVLADSREAVPYAQLALDKQERVIDDTVSHSKLAAERAADAAHNSAASAKKAVSIKERDIRDGLRNTHLGQDAADGLTNVRKQLSKNIESSMSSEFDILAKSGIDEVSTSPILDTLKKHRAAMEYNGKVEPRFENEHKAVTEMLNKYTETYGESVPPEQARKILTWLNQSLNDAFAKASGGGRMDRGERIVNEARAAFRTHIRTSLPDDVRKVYEATADETARLTKLSEQLRRVMGRADELTSAAKLEKVADRPRLMSVLDDASRSTGSDVADKVREFSNTRLPLKDRAAFEKLMEKQPEFAAMLSAKDVASQAEKGLEAFHPTVTRPAKEAQLAATKEYADLLAAKDALNAQQVGQSQARSWKAQAGEVPDVARTPEAAAVLDAITKDRALAQQLGGAKDAKTSLRALSSIGRNKATIGDTNNVKALGEMAGRDFAKEADVIDVIRQVKSARTAGSKNVRRLGNVAGSIVDTSGGELGLAVLDAQRALQNSPFLSTFNKIMEERGNEAAITAYRVLKSQGVVE